MDSRLLGLLLAFDTFACPRQSLQPFEGDGAVTGSAYTKLAGGDAIQSKLNFPQLCPALTVACKHGFLGSIVAGVVDNIARPGISDCAYFFLGLVHCTRQLTLLFPQTMFEQQKNSVSKWGM